MTTHTILSKAREELDKQLLPAFDRAAESVALGRNVLLHGEGDMFSIAKRLRYAVKGDREKIRAGALVHKIMGHDPSYDRTDDGFHIPFRAPHHTTPTRYMLGGGIVCRPGEVSLAHGGILLLSSLHEFRSEVLEVLRNIQSAKCAEVHRKSGNWTYPADFILVGIAQGSYEDCTVAEIRLFDVVIDVSAG